MNDTIFGKIIRGELPCDKVYEDEHCLAFRDINPGAPTHILLIPKKFIVNLFEASSQDKEVLGHLMMVSAKIASEHGLDGYRLVVNNGESAGQSVFHLHLHIMGGRPLEWPPG